MIILPPHVKRILLTGGAGFIGSHVLDLLAPSGVDITVYDNFTNGKMEYIESHLTRSNVKLIKADIMDLDRLVAATRGQDLVWHLAANTDIINSHDQPSRDLNDSAVGTFNVVEAMRRTDVRDIIFASSGAVYGNICEDQSVTEEAGPLLPVSTYGAGKIASEAFISSFCHVYGLRAWMYRFGNVIGARMTHGVIFDFVGRLRQDPGELLVRGDGRQEKNYFLVEECIDGMLYGYSNVAMNDDVPCGIFNLGTSTVTKVVDIAQVVVEEMSLPDARIRIEGTKKAWPGDQPRVHFEVGKFASLGWKSRMNSDQSVRIAVRRLLEKPDSLAWVL
ncbi:NAD-dependent epimerase/dehydratase family protein [Bradyrhizobium sp.]